MSHKATLSTLLVDPATRWQRITLPIWYGRQIEKPLKIASGVALWYRCGTPPRPIRWVLVRDPAGKRAPQAFSRTDTTFAPAEIIATFVRRWQVEVTFQKVRAHLGFETRRQWSDKAIEHTTPAPMFLYSLISLWAEDLPRQGATPHAAAWYRKNAFTLTDAIAAVRRLIWIGDSSDSSAHDWDVRKSHRTDSSAWQRHSTSRRNAQSQAQSATTALLTLSIQVVASARPRKKDAGPRRVEQSPSPVQISEQAWTR